MSINLVWRTDVHLADKGPSSRKDDWTDTVFDKLDQVRRVAAKVNAAAILDGGDFFNIKSPSRNSHALVHRTAEHHANYPCPVYCTPGNHDSVYGDYSFLPQQPLGVLFSTGVFKRLYDGYEVFFAGRRDQMYAKAYPYTKPKGGWTEDNPFAIPKNQRNGPIVRVVGVPYHGTSYDMERFTSIEKGDEDILICVAHVLASHKGGTMFEGEDIIKYKDLVDTAPDVFLFGHWHKDQGVEQIGDKTFVNIGSLTRGALSQDEVQRRPACAILTCNPATKDAPASVTTTVVRLRVKDAAEVFDVEARERQIQRQVEMDSFVNSIRDTLTRSDTTGDLSTLITDMDLSGDIRERALSYLERA
jgi:exonuclease SbcD